MSLIETNNMEPLDFRFSWPIHTSDAQVLCDYLITMDSIDHPKRHEDDRDEDER
jgi:hypothetical protein